MPILEGSNLEHKKFTISQIFNKYWKYCSSKFEHPSTQYSTDTADDYSRDGADCPVSRRIIWNLIWRPSEWQHKIGTNENYPLTFNSWKLCIRFKTKEFKFGTTCWNLWEKKSFSSTKIYWVSFPISQKVRVSFSHFRVKFYGFSN